MKLATQSVTLQVADGMTMNAYTARPAAEGRFPAMLLFQEAFDVNAHIRDVTDRMARKATSPIAPELFHRTAPEFEGNYTDIQSTMPHLQALRKPPPFRTFARLRSG
jgi:carboxymethylenebutenolidase